MEIKRFSQLKSTNSKAKELASKGAEPWTVVVSEKQTAGYGRKKSGWFSPKGGLYFSVILPKSQIEDLQTITILAAFIVAKVIKERFSLEPFIKLPNDIWVNGKKIAGILTENIIVGRMLNISGGVPPAIGSEVKLSVMGIGLNTNIDIGKFKKELANIATSLRMETGKETDNEQIMTQIVQGLKEQLKSISE